MTNRLRTVLYIGVTNNLKVRACQHKLGIVEGFSKKHKISKLIYFECYKYVEEAIAREKQLKNWHRVWKLNLIRKTNPRLKDLSQ